MTLFQLSSWSVSQRCVIFGVLAIYFLLLLPYTDDDHREHVKQWVSTSKTKYLGGDNLMDVQNSTLGFQKIYVIAMPDRTDKKDVWSLVTRYFGLEIEYVDGVRGEDIPEKGKPATWNPKQTNGNLGCYRAHMNVYQKIVSEQVSSALILEDDADFDVMLKSLLVEFARGTRHLQGITNPKGLHSPYGDDWDLFWMGHCGAKNRPEDDGRYYIMENDPTCVPPSQRSTDYGVDRLGPDLSAPELAGDFTRVIYHNRQGRCTTGYGISLRGAERFLYEFSIKPQAWTADKNMDKFCTARLSGAQCYAVFPSIFEPYRAPGSSIKDSDRLTHAKPTFRKEGRTEHCVFPVKPNLDQFVLGETIIQSQWPNVTLLPEIDIRTFQLEAGRPAFLRSSEFHPPPGY